MLSYLSGPEGKLVFSQSHHYLAIHRCQHRVYRSYGVLEGEAAEECMYEYSELEDSPVRSVETADHNTLKVIEYIVNHIVIYNRTRYSVQ